MKHGLALCCGQSPTLKDSYPSGFECKVCGKTKGGWASNNNAEWLASIWNNSCCKGSMGNNGEAVMLSPELDAGKEWRYAKLYFNNYVVGSIEQLELDFLLFKSDRSDYELIHGKNGYECHIDNDRVLRDFTLRGYGGNEVEFRLPIFKSGHCPFSVYVMTSSCTDGSGNFTFNINTYNSPKWTSIFLKELSKVFGYEVSFPQNRGRWY